MARRPIRKADSNQPQVFKWYRDLGMSIEATHILGQGFPDAVVGLTHAGESITDLIEIKDCEKIPSKRKLTEDEKEWFDAWQGSARVIESIECVVLHRKELAIMALAISEYRQLGHFIK